MAIAVLLAVASTFSEATVQYREFVIVLYGGLGPDCFVASAARNDVSFKRAFAPRGAMHPSRCMKLDAQ
jgi:hypothetical protein